MTGYRAFSPLFVKSFPILSQGFEIETEMTVHALDKNYSIAVLPVEYKDRPEGSESKLNTISDGFKVLWTIYELLKNYRPFLFFNTIALFLAIVGMGFMVPVLINYFETGLVPKLPTFIASCFCVLCAILFFFCGVILDVISKKHKQEFEILLNTLSLMIKK